MSFLDALNNAVALKESAEASSLFFKTLVEEAVIGADAADAVLEFGLGDPCLISEAGGMVDVDDDEDGVLIDPESEEDGEYGDSEYSDDETVGSGDSDDDRLLDELEEGLFAESSADQTKLASWMI